MSRPMRIVAPITKRTQIDNLTGFEWHLLLVLTSFFKARFPKQLTRVNLFVKNNQISSIFTFKT